MVYNISYDLHAPKQKYDQLPELILKISNGKWSHILDSTYIIQSFSSAEQIYNSLLPALDHDDKIFISEITQSYYGQLKTEQWRYIENLF
ncbi:hypothetical protein CLPUN_38030 [Clostridium puniceum]|uniref:Uncharacterized protein n=1 Tax=Clostridium puniceum TaxID=29367 RepID=A0A1S8TA56_9CLOT|nr:hypothetical protein [Clostridium puniceum]OOM74562.1 hypothetical protein CLPUN_38030 [Clostridium puniceum]